MSTNILDFNNAFGDPFSEANSIFRSIAIHRMIPLTNFNALLIG